MQPIWLFLTVALLAAAFFGSRLFLSTGSDPYRTIAPLDIASYMENANSLRGNIYKVEGEVSNSLAWSPTAGRLFAVDVDKGRDTIPVLVTAEFNHLNIQKGQKFFFVVEVDDKGLLRTKEVSKS